MMSKRYVLLLWVGLAAAVAMPSCTKHGLTGSSPITAAVRKVDLTITVRGGGKLEAAESMRVTAPLWWKPITWVIPEGTMVKKDDLIVKFEKKDIENEYLTAKADYAVAEAELQKVKKELEAKKHELDAEIESYQADMAIAELELARLRDLPRPDDIRQKKATLRRAKATFDVAKEEYERMARFKGLGFLADAEIRQMISEMKEAESGFICAQTDLRVAESGAHPDTIREAELEVERAKIALEQAKQGLPGVIKQLEAAVEKQTAQAEKSRNVLDQKTKDLKNTELTAPVDGMVVYRTVDQKKIAKGVKMWKGCAIMDLPDLSKMIVKTKIREDRVHRVKAGQGVIVHIDALPEQDFTGEVKEVGKIAKDKAEGEVLGWGQEKQESGIKVFDVTIEIEESDKRLVPNLIAKLDILVNKIEGALVVPIDAVKKEGDEEFVYVRLDGRVEKRLVKLGPECEDLVVIESGLNEGERVCLSQERRRDQPDQNAENGTEEATGS